MNKILAFRPTPFTSCSESWVIAACISALHAKETQPRRCFFTLRQLSNLRPRPCNIFSKCLVPSHLGRFKTLNFSRSKSILLSVVPTFALAYTQSKGVVVLCDDVDAGNECTAPADAAGDC